MNHLTISVRFGFQGLNAVYREVGRRILLSCPLSGYFCFIAFSKRNLEKPEQVFDFDHCRSVFLMMVPRRRMDLKRLQVQNHGQRAKNHLPMGQIKKTRGIIWCFESVIKCPIRLS
jgi:hypothetical protein